MSKLDLDMDFDFGFSAVSEDELKETEKAATQSAQHYKDQRDALYKMITPLINNLLKNSDKPYIHWADREAKLKEFKAKIDRLVAD